MTKFSVFLSNHNFKYSTTWLLKTVFNGYQSTLRWQRIASSKIFGKLDLFVIRQSSELADAIILSLKMWKILFDISLCLFRPHIRNVWLTRWGAMSAANFCQAHWLSYDAIHQNKPQTVSTWMRCIQNSSIAQWCWIFIMFSEPKTALVSGCRYPK